MALTPDALRLLTPILEGAKVLCFGFPDVLASRVEASQIIGQPLLRESLFGANHKRKEPIADTLEIFDALKASVTFVDSMPSRHVEQVVDLNYRHTFGWHDVVIDAGTIEHVANIGCALMNAAESVKPSGYVFHSPPLVMVNHGFYSVSPTLLVDFYEQNNWEVLYLSAFLARPPYAQALAHARARFEPAHGTALYFLARRRDDSELKWPVQSKYLNRKETAA